MTRIRSRQLGLGILAVLATAFLLTACLNEDQQKSFDLLNQRRAQNGRPALKLHDLAQKKAQAWAEKLAREKKLYHSNLRDGMGSCWRNLGENVGYANSIARVHDLWWNSPGHKANLLNTVFTGVGVGVAKASNGQFYVVHVFVRPC